MKKFKKGQDVWFVDECGVFSYAERATFTKYYHGKYLLKNVYYNRDKGTLFDKVFQTEEECLNYIKGQVK